MQTNLQILEALLNNQPNKQFHTDSLGDFDYRWNTINNLPSLNHYNPNEPDKIFLYDYMEEAIYYYKDRNRETLYYTDNNLIAEAPGIKIYSYQFC